MKLFRRIFARIWLTYSYAYSNSIFRNWKNPSITCIGVPTSNHQVPGFYVNFVTIALILRTYPIGIPAVHDSQTLSHYATKTACINNQAGLYTKNSFWCPYFEAGYLIVSVFNNVKNLAPNHDLGASSGRFESKVLVDFTNV